MECLVCKHKYIKFGNYLRHLSIEHPDISTENIRNENKQKDPLDTTQNKCKICYKIFPSLHKLNIHSRTHLEVLAFQCNQCESSFPNKTRLRLHKEGIHTKGEFVCIICHLICNNKLALNRHNRIHKEGAKTRHKCTECGRIHSSVTSLKSHLVTHKKDKPFECEICGISFSRISTLNSHSKLHSESKDFSCVICNDTFVTKNSLKKHQICHSAEKPFSCPDCDKTFARKGDLNVHKRTHTNTRLFTCPVCDKSFLRSSHLNSHQKLHTRDFICQKCGISFDSNQFSDYCRHRNSCKLNSIEKDFLPDLPDFNRFSPISFYSEDRHTLSPLLANQMEELYTESQQYSLMSHTANEAVTQALKSVVHTPDTYDVTQQFPFHSYHPTDLSANQFDEYIFPPNMHILGSGFDVSVRGVSSNITPLIGSYLTN